VVLRELGIASGVTQKNLKEIVNFLNTKESGYKYFNGTYFFVAHGFLYLIKAPKKFWILPPNKFGKLLEKFEKKIMFD